jgi:hypothetical protein
MSANGHQRLARAERNEQAYKDHNERRAEMDEEGGVPEDEPVPFACECDDPGCARAIELPLAEYERASAPIDQFVIVPGHEDPEVEVVVETHDSDLVVSKPDLRRPDRSR